MASFGANSSRIICNRKWIVFYRGFLFVFLVQLKGVSVIAIFSFTFTYVVMQLIKKTAGVRISIEEERVGIDAASFGLEFLL